MNETVPLGHEIQPSNLQGSNQGPGTANRHGKLVELGMAWEQFTGCVSSPQRPHGGPSASLSLPVESILLRDRPFEFCQMSMPARELDNYGVRRAICSYRMDVQMSHGSTPRRPWGDRAGQ
ncbi:predicted protein [Coccidioides posadasii str. Silveira]|uniref:Predicted protein n=2 Tax=Coccidioides posadasii TaxID=199306 RepID=E9CVX5_COCPS|nr:predicted protein [Coccidioides posadasii str. Silveira]KMM64928.1 hypothetical protein CPAG_01280 [Coccidioides posadasii RMSCC 3488]